MFVIVLFAEQIGKLGSDRRIIIVPGSCPARTLAALPLDRVADVRPVPPKPERLLDPRTIAVCLEGRHRFADERRARSALLDGTSVQPTDVVLGDVDQRSHRDDIAHRYHLFKPVAACLPSAVAPRRSCRES